MSSVLMLKAETRRNLDYGFMNSAQSALNPTLTLESQAKVHYNLSLRFRAFTSEKLTNSGNPFLVTVLGPVAGMRREPSLLAGLLTFVPVVIV